VNGPSVVVDVLMPGRPADEQLLSAAAAGADSRYRLEGDPGPALSSLAHAVQDLQSKRHYDLIAAGANALDGGPCLPAYLAGVLGRSYHDARTIAIGMSGAPAVIGMAATGPAAGPETSAVIDALLHAVTVLGPAARGQTREQPVFLPSAVSPAPVPAVTTVAEAADFLKAYAASTRPAQVNAYEGAMSAGEPSRERAVWVMLDTGQLRSNLSVLRAGSILAATFGRRSRALITAPRASWPGLLGLARANGIEQAFCMDTDEQALSWAGRREILRRVAKQADATMVVAGTSWNEALAAVAGELLSSADLDVRVITGIVDVRSGGDGGLILRASAYEGRLMRQTGIVDEAAFVSVADEADLPSAEACRVFRATVLEMPLSPDWLVPLPPPPAATLARAEVIIDVGYGIRDRSGLELALRLQANLESMGLAPMIGATRKVTQDLKLLPLDAQIGQTGVRVNPKLVIALGISGAPQHTDYLGMRADILCFNKDPEAPLMKLNASRPAPRVHPVPGDLFATLPELITRLGSER
jgi:electron transfer flavoprotein alpha subunit